MRLATAIKRKVIPHICQPTPRNSGRSDVAELSGQWLKNTYIQSVQQLASGSSRGPLFESQNRRLRPLWQGSCKFPGIAA